MASHAICRRPVSPIVTDFGKSTEATMVMREGRKKKRVRPGASDLANVFSRFFRIEKRSVHEVIGKCRVTPKFVTGANRRTQRPTRLKKEECPFLRVTSSGRDPRGAERTRFPRSTLANVDHRGKNLLNTPLMSRLYSTVACGYAISLSLTFRCVRVELVFGLVAEP